MPDTDRVGVMTREITPDAMAVKEHSDGGERLNLGLGGFLEAVGVYQCTYP